MSDAYFQFVAYWWPLLSTLFLLILVLWSTAIYYLCVKHLNRVPRAERDHARHPISFREYFDSQVIHVAAIHGVDPQRLHVIAPAELLTDGDLSYVTRLRERVEDTSLASAFLARELYDTAKAIRKQEEGAKP